MAHKPWREIATKANKNPERIARIEAETLTMLAISALAQVRETRNITQGQLATRLAISQPRVSHIENQDDITLSTLAEYVNGMGGRLALTVVFPDATVELASGVRNADRQGQGS